MQLATRASARTQHTEHQLSVLPATIIMQMEKIFSLSVSAAMFPNPTEVMQVMV